MNRVSLRAAVLIALLICAWAQTKIMDHVQEILTPVDILVPSADGEEPHHEIPHERGVLEPLPLQAEIPRNVTEFTSIAPPQSRDWWRQSMYVDFLFIAAYVMLFAALPFQVRRVETIWESVFFCAVITGVADVIENEVILSLLDHLDRGDAIGGTRTLAALPIIGGIKWLLFFLTCRALSIDLEKLLKWRFFSVAFRALSTAGSWAVLLTVVRLPARPLITIAFLGSALVLVGFAVLRLLGFDAGAPAPDLTPIRVRQEGTEAVYAASSTS